MKLTCLLLALIVLMLPGTAMSQIHQRGWEFSVSGTFASLSTKTETSGAGGTTTSETASQNLFSLLLRPGFFVIDGLEIEPEFLWGLASNGPPSYSVSGNVAYNWMVPNSQVALFALAGYGVGNGIPALERMVTRSSEAFDITVLNLGAGTKVFVSKQVAFRAEYRFQQYTHNLSGAVSAGGSSPTTKYIYSFHNAFLGVSVFLP